MGSDTIPLWAPALQKEALDVLVEVWPGLSAEMRIALVERIVLGPPLPEAEPEDQEERERLQRWFDRRIFERLALIERLGEPPLPPFGAGKLADLRVAYPRWQINEGDRAHFSSWIESYVGLETDRSPQELRMLSGTKLIAALRVKGIDREGRLSVWSQVVAGKPARGVGLLHALSCNSAPGDEAIWQSTLYGLRDAMSRSAVARRVVEVLIEMPEAIMMTSHLLSATSDALETASKQQSLPIRDDAFFRLWDRLVEICLKDEADVSPEGHDWVGRAINRPIGRLTTALLNILSRQGLKAAQGFPLAFKGRLDQIATDQSGNSRLARTILASRLLYLFAVDPAWTRERLLPSFDWTRSEEEATAAWRGYGWGARINADLWSELSPQLYQSFSSERRERLGRTSKTLASLLMVAGVEFPEAEVPTEQSRRAIRAMAPEDRAAAASWLYSFLAGPAVNEQAAPLGAEQAGRTDHVWTKQVLPWLRRVWPRDAALVTPETSEKFALLAVATQDSFPEAVNILLPYMIGIDYWATVVHNLLLSRHPDDHPAAVLRLVGKTVFAMEYLFANELRTVLNRVVAADPALHQDPIFRRLDTALRANSR